MCGIVGAVMKSDALPVLMEGLRRLEYRGYDSAGVALIDHNDQLNRQRSPGKLAHLNKRLKAEPVRGKTGIAHTRWATHGLPTEMNAHPHVCNGQVALVCNGIIENHEDLRRRQIKEGFNFSSETDTEVVVHEICGYINQNHNLRQAVQQTMNLLTGAFAIAVIHPKEPDTMVGARHGPPLIVGIGDGEAFIASDIAALLPVTREYMVLEEGDVVEVKGGRIRIWGSGGELVRREVYTSQQRADAVDLGEYRHYMLKETFEQSKVIADTLESRVAGDRLLEDSFGPQAGRVFDQTAQVQIIACGTSYHAGLVAKHWLESFGVPCQIEVASEFRYRSHVKPDRGLVVTISQSGETADTLAALEEAKRIGFAYSLTICNTPESSLVRLSDLCFMTHAGPEIGVASTKAFTTQLTALLLLTIALARRQGLSAAQEATIVQELVSLPQKVDHALALDDVIKSLAEQFADKHHALFLGRGAHFPIALEGALKLKEISYIHAEAYPAGELKHGPLALVDANMPVIAVAPNNQLLEKLKSNLQEVKARGGKLIVFADVDAGLEEDGNMQVVRVAPVDECISPIIYTIPLQLLAYHVAVIKGTDVDKPRNLAKSVTVE